MRTSLADAALQPALEAERDAHLVLRRARLIRRFAGDLRVLEVDGAIHEAALRDLRAHAGIAATRASCIDPVVVHARRVYPWWRRVWLLLRMLDPWWPRV